MDLKQKAQMHYDWTTGVDKLAHFQQDKLTNTAKVICGKDYLKPLAHMSARVAEAAGKEDDVGAKIQHIMEFAGILTKTMKGVNDKHGRMLGLLQNAAREMNDELDAQGNALLPDFDLLVPRVLPDNFEDILERCKEDVKGFQAWNEPTGRRVSNAKADT